MDIKELEAKFIASHCCGTPQYVNYLFAEYDDGGLLFITACDGHDKMDDALICHDKMERDLSNLEQMNNTMKKRLAGHSIVFVKKIHTIIVKETTTVEFLED